MAAMAALVAREGYRGVRTTELATVAGVSKSALYHHFTSKEDCFMALHERIVANAAERIDEALGCGAGPREGLEAGLVRLAALIGADPAAARVVLLAAPELGGAGLECRRSAGARFEAIVARCLAADGGRSPDALARAIVAGIAAVARRRLRDAGAGERVLPVDELTGWAIDLAAGEDEAALRAALATRGRRPAGGAGEVPWSESPRSRRSRRELALPERFARGAAWVAVARGADALSIPAVSHAAASSNEAFYRCFMGADEALLDAFARLADRALAACREGPRRPPTLAGSLAAALAALRGDLATGFFFPRLALVELPALRRRGALRAEQALDSLAAVLVPVVPGRGPAVREAQAGALWGLVEDALGLDSAPLRTQEDVARLVIVGWPNGRITAGRGRGV